MIYYIDFINGKKENNGLTQKTPINYYEALPLEKNDVVLFKRGTFIRGKLHNLSGVSYGAYGDGENPTFCGSHNAWKDTLWKEVENCVWQYTGKLRTEVCNFVFNNGKSCGTLRWEKEDLKQQGDFWDNCFGINEEQNPASYDNHIVLLYSIINPAFFYDDIECVTRDSRNLCEMVEDTTISDINFINNGVHAISGLDRAKNVSIKNCEFRFIGGCVWSKELKIRFGNAIECWNICENVTVENCLFDDIYDSAVTHQGGSECQYANRFIIRNNTFKKCGMASYEQRDLMPLYAEFCDNICEEAGEGFSKLGEIMPRRSEIWPQPMGHHIFLWRIEKPTENGGIIVKNNKFGSAPYGSAIYSIISTDANKQIIVEENS